MEVNVECSGNSEFMEAQTNIEVREKQVVEDDGQQFPGHTTT